MFPLSIAVLVFAMPFAGAALYTRLVEPPARLGLAGAGNHAKMIFTRALASAGWAGSSVRQGAA